MHTQSGASPDQTTPAQPRVVIAGGGVAGLEAALALADLASDAAEISLISPEPEFLYKPLTVEEPFTNQPAARMELAPLLSGIGVKYVGGAVKSVSPELHSIELGASGGAVGPSIAYDFLIICIGGRMHPAYERAETFSSSRSDLPVDEMIRKAASSPSKTMALVVPPGTSWPLPLYELALLTRRRSEELGFADLKLRVYTPEDAPLLIFGRPASDEVNAVLSARRISVEVGATVVQADGGELRILPGGSPLDEEVVLALPRIDGPAVNGIPADEHGFIPVDEYARVIGTPDVYAAGDGTSFPVKQGGLATQQADVAAEHIASTLGIAIEPTPFRPVLRGQLITGAESLNLKHELTGGHGEGVASLDYLWWPPQKIGGRYLAALLGHEPVRDDLEPPFRGLKVEVAFPHEWHEELLSWDAEVRSS